MSVEIRRGSSRFVDTGPGWATWHSFSFGAHYDPAHVSFGPMVCHDEHRLSAGAGFDTHRHADLVIVTWVLSGALAHSDSTGGSAEVRPGSVAVLRAGAGVEHSELASAPQTRFVQVWLTDPDPPAEPSYDVSVATSVVPLPGAAFTVIGAQAGEAVTLPAAPLLHVFVAGGALTRSSLAEPLHAGDAFLMTDEPAHAVTAGVPTELLVWAFE